jgi:cell division protein DivIC
MSILKQIFHVLINKYLLTTVAFVIWMVFFDSNNLLTRNKLQEKLDSLYQARNYYLQEIRKDSMLSVGLMNDTTQLERFARERYLMKKDNEDLFLVIDTTEDQRQ